MSYVVATPEMMTAAAADLATIGSTLDAAHTAAAVSTVAVVPAAADEVSVRIAQLFSEHARDYQGLAGKAAAFQEQFVQHLNASALSYASIEDALASLLQTLTSADSFGTTLTEFGYWLSDVSVQVYISFSTWLSNLLDPLILSPYLLPLFEDFAYIYIVVGLSIVYLLSGGTVHL
jgi:hypothetical protein